MTMEKCIKWCSDSFIQKFTLDMTRDRDDNAAKHFNEFKTISCDVKFNGCFN